MKIIKVESCNDCPYVDRWQHRAACLRVGTLMGKMSNIPSGIYE